MSEGIIMNHERELSCIQEGGREKTFFEVLVRAQ